MDADHTGTLSVDGIKDVCYLLGMSLDDSDVIRVMKSIDTNADGRVGFPEFCDWWVLNSHKNKFQLRDPHEYFREVDQDGDGTLDKSEVKKLCEALGMKPLKPKQVGQLMADIDIDCNGVISIDEFTLWWLERGDAVYRPAIPPGPGDASWAQRVADHERNAEQVQQERIARQGRAAKFKAGVRQVGAMKNMMRSVGNIRKGSSSSTANGNGSGYSADIGSGWKSNFDVEKPTTGEQRNGGVPMPPKRPSTRLASVSGGRSQGMGLRAFGQDEEQEVAAATASYGEGVAKAEYDDGFAPLPYDAADDGGDDEFRPPPPDGSGGTTADWLDGGGGGSDTRTVNPLSSWKNGYDGGVGVHPLTPGPRLEVDHEIMAPHEIDDHHHHAALDDRIDDLCV